jgi:hypothetical protein
MTKASLCAGVLPDLIEAADHTLELLGGDGQEATKETDDDGDKHDDVAHDDEQQ